MVQLIERSLDLSISISDNTIQVITPSGDCELSYTNLQ